MEAEFTSPDPDFSARIHKSFSEQGIMSHIGATLTHLEPGLCEISVPYQDHLSQQHGFFHGGITGLIADSAGGYAAASLFDARDEILTVEYKLNLIAPADGDVLVAKGRVIKSGKTLSVTTADVFVEKDKQSKQIAVMQQTLIRLR